MFRLFKTIHFLDTLVKNFFQEKDSFVRSISVLQNLCLSIWMVYDNVIWAGKTGLVKLDLNPISRKSNTFWLASMICGIIKSLYLLNKYQQQIIDPSLKKEDIRSFQTKQMDTAEDLIRLTLDTSIPLTSINAQASQLIPTGIVGLLGTITSIIGIHQAWKKL